MNSYSFKKLIKNVLRSTLGQDRLSSLDILAAYVNLPKQIDFDKAIVRFAADKSHNWHLFNFDQ